MIAPGVQISIRATNLGYQSSCKAVQLILQVHRLNKDNLKMKDYFEQEIPILEIIN